MLGSALQIPLPTNQPVHSNLVILGNKKMNTNNNKNFQLLLPGEHPAAMQTSSCGPCPSQTALIFLSILSMYLADKDTISLFAKYFFLNRLYNFSFVSQTVRWLGVHAPATTTNQDEEKEDYGGSRGGTLTTYYK